MRPVREDAAVGATWVASKLAGLNRTNWLESAKNRGVWPSPRRQHEARLGWVGCLGRWLPMGPRGGAWVLWAVQRAAFPYLRCSGIAGIRVYGDTAMGSRGHVGARFLDCGTGALGHVTWWPGVLPWGHLGRMRTIKGDESSSSDRDRGRRRVVWELPLQASRRRTAVRRRMVSVRSEPYGLLHVRRQDVLLADDLVRRGDVLHQPLRGYQDGRRSRRHPV